jgi:hypothetical protein
MTKNHNELKEGKFVAINILKDRVKNSLGAPACNDPYRGGRNSLDRIVVADSKLACNDSYIDTLECVQESLCQCRSVVCRLVGKQQCNFCFVSVTPVACGTTTGFSLTR